MKVVAPLALARVRFMMLCFLSKGGTAVVRTVDGALQFILCRAPRMVLSNFKLLKEGMLGPLSIVALLALVA